MAEKNNATCSICGRDYHVCLSCQSSLNLSPWKRFTDTSEHYKVYQIVRGVNTGIYNKDEAKTRLQMVDLSDLNTFRPHIKSLIEDILKEENVAVETDKESTIVEEIVVKSEIEDTKSRKRKSSKLVETE